MTTDYTPTLPVVPNMAGLQAVADELINTFRTNPALFWRDLHATVVPAIPALTMLIYKGLRPDEQVRFEDAVLAHGGRVAAKLDW